MPGYPYGLGRGFGLPSGLPSTRAMTLRGSSNMGGNLQPSYNQGRLNFSGASSKGVVVRGQRQPDLTGQNSPTFADKRRALIIPRTAIEPKVPYPVAVRNNAVEVVKPKVRLERGMPVGAGVPPGKTIRGAEFRTRRSGSDIAKNAGTAINLAASVELTRKWINSSEPVEIPKSIPKSKFTDMVGISFGDMGRTEEVAERNNQQTIQTSKIKSKRQNSPGQKSKNDTLNVGVGSKNRTTYEVQLRGGDIFPLDKTIGKLAAFPVTVIGKVLKVGGGMLTEE